jgi:2',3'-cyclic-nucleotide 2'-phosphodiesterase (5'-nucleotidase family)
MTFAACLLGCATVAISCKSHYQLNTTQGVVKTRILIDQRWDATPDAKAVAWLAPYKSKVDSIMSPVMGRVAHDMAAERPESDLSNLLADIMVWAAKDYGETVDFGVYNMGGIRAALNKGDVTWGDVLAIAPFENKICFLTLSGKDVLELFHNMACTGGEAVSKEVRLEIETYGNNQGKVLSATVGGKPVDPKASYRIVTIDYLAQGNDKMTAFKAKTNYNAPSDESNNSRYIIMNYFKRHMEEGITIDSKVEGRIKRVLINKQD